MNKVLLIIIISSIFLAKCSKTDREESEKNDSKEMASSVDMTIESLGVDTTFKIPYGLQVGAKVPGIGARDLNGNPIDLYTVLREGPVVMVFYRGKWCGYCNKFMANLSDSVSLIKHLGAKVIAITPETRTNAEEMTQKNNLAFPVISDPGNNIMNAFDVSFKVNEEYSKKVSDSNGFTISANNGTSEEYLPVPATYIISQDGTIVYRHFDMNFRKRAPISEVLSVLKNLPKS